MPVTAEAADMRADLTATIAALSHARSMANYASDVRMRNFNFFIVITGALITGQTQLSVVWSPVLAVAGVITSVFFFGLDVRVRGIHKRSIDQLAILEPMIWQQAGIEGWSPRPRHGGKLFVSHTWIYRAFFLIAGFGSPFLYSFVRS